MIPLICRIFGSFEVGRELVLREKFSADSVADDILIWCHFDLDFDLMSF